MIYPAEITSPKAKMVYWYMKQSYAFMIGKDRIVGRATQMLPEITMFTIAVDYFGIYDIKNNPVISIIAVGLCVLFGMAMCWVAGKMYMRYNLDRISSIVSNERNSYMQELYDKVVKKHKRTKY